MALIVAYVGLVIAGDFIAYLIGRIFEIWSDKLGLIVFLGCFVLVFVIAWKIAVRLTEPKVQTT